MKVAVLDHGMGNLRSVSRALEAAGAEVLVTSSPQEIERSDALCVPGQGILDRCMANISDAGLADLVGGWVAAERPYLGICLGMQVLFDNSEEAGGTKALGIISGEVRRLPDRVTVPHIGWNLVADEHYYFDHSYAAFPDDHAVVSGWCLHGERFAARIETGSVTGVQFHPEKSGAAGIRYLETWVASL